MANTMKHTPAPWRQLETEATMEIYAPTITAVARIHKRWDSSFREDAQLIAAAPELLEALKRAIHLLELAEQSPHKVKWGTKYDCLTPPETMAELKEAIAKATGDK